MSPVRFLSAKLAVAQHTLYTLILLVNGQNLLSAEHGVPVPAEGHGQIGLPLDQPLLPVFAGHAARQLHGRHPSSSDVP